MARGNGTQDSITPVEIPRSRAKRFTMGNGIRVKWTTLTAIIGLLVFVAGGVVFVWRASTAFSGKAEAADVEAVETKVNTLGTDVKLIKKDVEWIRSDQRKILKALEK